MSHQTKEELASSALGKARQFIKLAQNEVSEMAQHKGGYTTTYKTKMTSNYHTNLKLAQQLLHYAIDNITGISNVATNPTKTKLEELEIVTPEPEE